MLLEPFLVIPVQLAKTCISITIVPVCLSMTLSGCTILSYCSIIVVRDVIIVLLSLGNLVGEHSGACLNDHLLAIGLTVGDKCLIPIGDTGEIPHRRAIGVVQFIDNFLLISL